MINKTVLIAEDEAALAHIVRDSLEERGFKVLLCHNGKHALMVYQASKPDILVLDIMMPVMDGLEVAKQVRKIDSQTPILFLTAKTQTKNVLEGFGAGANDYLRKPFSIEELIARIQVQLGNRGFNKFGKYMPSEFTIGSFQFFADQHQLKYVDKIWKLTARESEILRILINHPHQFVEKKEILERVWGSDTFFNARSLDVFISRLRKILAVDPQVKILNLRGVGFKIVC